MAASPVPPSPVPTALQVGEATLPDGSKMVFLQIASPVGVAFYFIAHETAAKLVEQLTTLTSGIIKPTLAQTLAGANAKFAKT